MSTHGPRQPAGARPAVLPVPGADHPSRPVEIRLLGPIEVLVAGEPVDLGHLRQRAVLAVLALEANRMVTRDGLIDRVWDDRPPPTARNLLSGYLGRLRSRLLPATDRLTLTRAAGGYLLRVAPETVDEHRFTALLGRARELADGPEAAGLLEQAESLWQGPALAGATGQWLDGVRRRLTDERLAAVLRRNDILLRQGGHDRLLPALGRLAAEHRTDERVAAQLVLALHLAGRSAQALAVHAATRRHLRDELGLDPGPRLRTLERWILTGDAAHAPAGVWPAPAAAAAPHHAPADTRPAVARRTTDGPPRQLPAAPDRFVGRASALATLDALLAPAPADRAALVTVTGMPGVGKTGLALHWAHRVSGAFPDGQLHAELGGSGRRGPVDLRPVLLRFLRSLGEQGPAPRDLAEAAARYRSTLAGRRMLIVLDDAHDVEQVRHLLPGVPGCLTVVTSRFRLAGLTSRYGARHLPLGMLTGAESRALLRRLLDDAGQRPDAEVVQRLAELGAGLPLALRAAAVTSRQAGPGYGWSDRPVTPADRMARLDVPGDPDSSVRDSFGRSYRRLCPAARRMFRLLGRYCVGPVPLSAAAALAGTDVTEARRLLAVLIDAHLVEPDDGSGYVMPDLLRFYAAGLAGADGLLRPEGSGRVTTGSPDGGVTGTGRRGDETEWVGRWAGGSRLGRGERARGRGGHGVPLRPSRAGSRRP